MTPEQFMQLSDARYFVSMLLSFQNKPMNDNPDIVALFKENSAALAVCYKLFYDKGDIKANIDKVEKAITECQKKHNEKIQELGRDFELLACKDWS